MKPYLITLSSTAETTVEARSAADAIQEALMRNPGETITRCQLKPTWGGNIEYEVPKHTALTPEDAYNLRNNKPQRRERPDWADDKAKGKYEAWKARPWWKD